LLKEVKRVTLAHNLIRKIENLDHCFKLSMLDLGFNKITSVEDIHTVLGGLKVLILCNNELKSTSSLEKLYSLEKLDVSNNLIEDADEIKRLSELPLLVYLNTLGNPVCIRNRRTRASSREECYQLYRREILAHAVLERGDINDRLRVLDEQPVNDAEIQRALQAKRYKACNRLGSLISSGDRKN
jgi:calcineurin-like phosphoesterase family protein